MQEIANRNTFIPAADGAAVIERKDLSRLVVHYSQTFIDLLVLRIEDDARKTSSSFPPEMIDRLNFMLELSANTAERSDLLREVHARMSSLALKIQRGLDYFGFSIDQVPNRTADFYSNEIKTNFLPGAALVEAAFNQFLNTAADTEERRLALAHAFESAKTTKLSLRALYTNRKRDAAQALAGLEMLDARVVAAEERLLKAKAELDAAIARSRPGCDLMNTIVAVGTIVAAVHTGGSSLLLAASNTSELIQQYKNSDQNLFELLRNKDFKKTLKEIKTEGQDAAKAFNSIQDAMKELDKDNLRIPQFIIEREAFDRVANNFSNLIEAQEYKIAGNDFLASVESRNQAILDYNANLIQIFEFRSQLDAAMRAENAVSSSINRLASISEDQLFSTMMRVYLDTLALLARMVHLFKKAAHYDLAIPASAPVSALNVSTLTAAFQATTAQLITLGTIRRQLLRAVTIDLRAVAGEDAWQAMIESGILQFSLRPQDIALAPLPALRATGLQVRSRVAPGVNSVQGRSLRLIHCGTERVFVSDGVPVVFVRRPQSYTLVLATDEKTDPLDPDITEAGKFQPVSPYSSWTLELRRVSREERENLADITLRILGYIFEE